MALAIRRKTQLEHGIFRHVGAEYNRSFRWHIGAAVKVFDYNEAGALGSFQHHSAHETYFKTASAAKAFEDNVSNAWELINGLGKRSGINAEAIDATHYSEKGLKHFPEVAHAASKGYPVRLTLSHRVGRHSLPSGKKAETAKAKLFFDYLNRRIAERKYPFVQRLTLPDEKEA